MKHSFSKNITQYNTMHAAEKYLSLNNSNNIRVRLLYLYNIPIIIRHKIFEYLYPDWRISN